ncbi:hypothetical protein GX50_07999 [[Emmonsia] crescens]|uniref:GPI-anchored cell wall protein n=1 Tax=[Emmonsia] crescens TaxID=73230 RepID=A0A2B7Z768_9EURO|nr:hypothetical protein GX50_07999 [Emmonsia crescens]
MFASKFIFFAALLALFNAVIAVTPGCLLGAINTQTNPGDLKKICADQGVQREIVKMCPENVVKDALKSFSDSCAEAGQKVSLIDINKPTGTSPSGSTDGGDNGSGNSPTSTGPGGSPSGTGTSAGYVHKIDSLSVAGILALVGLVSAM